METTEAPKSPRSVDERWEEGAISVGRIRRRKKRYDEPLVNLTSMVDVLSVLLFFLLSIYSGGGYLTILPSGLKLPNSSTERGLTKQIEVAVMRDQILVDRRAVADRPADYLESQELVLPGLQAALAALVPAKPEDARVTIQADREIPFRLLKKIIYTADQAGFRRQSLAVHQVTG